jgi:hypothetical protein
MSPSCKPLYSLEGLLDELYVYLRLIIKHEDAGDVNPAFKCQDLPGYKAMYVRSGWRQVPFAVDSDKNFDSGTVCLVFSLEKETLLYAICTYEAFPSKIGSDVEYITDLNSVRIFTGPENQKTDPLEFVSQTSSTDLEVEDKTLFAALAKVCLHA